MFPSAIAIAPKNNRRVTHCDRGMTNKHPRVLNKHRRVTYCDRRVPNKYPRVLNI